VLADEVQLQRAVKNIVHNAVKYSPAGSKIEISATTNGDEAVIAVRDHGPGIPRDDLERIFERFFQVDRSRRSGTGLGLAIVRHIVLAHGGRVWVESDEGHGATFYISLVLAEPVLQNNIILG
jgi:two-component system sensor histidine kinase VicK